MTSPVEATPARRRRPASQARRAPARSGCGPSRPGRAHPRPRSRPYPPARARAAGNRFRRARRGTRAGARQRLQDVVGGGGGGRGAGRVRGGQCGRSARAARRRAAAARRAGRRPGASPPDRGRPRRGASSSSAASSRQRHLGRPSTCVGRGASSTSGAGRRCRPSGFVPRTTRSAARCSVVPSAQPGRALRSSTSSAAFVSPYGRRRRTRRGWG